MAMTVAELKELAKQYKGSTLGKIINKYLALCAQADPESMAAKAMELEGDILSGAIHRVKGLANMIRDPETKVDSIAAEAAVILETSENNLIYAHGHILKVVDGCNAIYAYHLTGGEYELVGCCGADTTVGEVLEDIRSDLFGFCDAYCYDLEGAGKETDDQ